MKKALKKCEDPWEAYNKEIPGVTLKLLAATECRPWDVPGYLGISLINWDHFGDDARTAYNTGHAAAIQVAKKGNLKLAYAMNAFADHYLEDSFAAGHIRTPRRQLHGELVRDYCAKVSRNSLLLYHLPPRIVCSNCLHPAE